MVFVKNYTANLQVRAHQLSSRAPSLPISYPIGATLSSPKRLVYLSSWHRAQASTSREPIFDGVHASKRSRQLPTFFFCLPPPDLAGLEDPLSGFCSFLGACATSKHPRGRSVTEIPRGLAMHLMAESPPTQAAHGLGSVRREAHSTLEARLLQRSHRAAHDYFFLAA